MTIILADAEREYLDILSTRLTQLVPGLVLVSCTCTADLTEQVNKSGQRKLIIFNSADFPGLQQALDVDNRCKIDYWPVSSNEQAVLSSGNGLLNRTGLVTVLAEKLRVWLASSKSDEPGCDYRTAYHKKIASSGLHLLFCAEPGGYRPDLSRQRLAGMVQLSDTVIYLPLMPTYKMSCVTLPGKGPNLSDLLLRLLAKDIEPCQLGHFLQPHPDGYLQFRPPDRSDDLTACSIEMLRQMIVILRSYLIQITGRSAALVDFAGLPLSALAAVAVLCNSCEFVLPERDCFATRAAQAEIGRILAELPPECTVTGNFQRPASVTFDLDRNGDHHDS